jgi:UDP-GlcNAc3NAcA epimerase
MLDAAGWKPDSISLMPPVSYFEMLLLESRARFVLTDSGGVQKEAYFFERPCVTMRDETEWTETLENRCNVLAGADERRIVAAAQGSASAGPWLARYGDGHASDLIAVSLMKEQETEETGTA